MVQGKYGQLAGWGNYPVEQCHLLRPDKVQEIQEMLATRQQPDYIARGLGRSYGDTALNKESGVILQTQLQRFLAFDEASGVLECEAGVSLAEIVATFLPRGYFLPVTPGTKYVTVGGAIANDVHGKNHHKDGCLSAFLLDLELLTADGRVQRCSRTENAELFWATVGGIGLTGIILRARIQLRPVESAYLDVDYQRAANLDQALDLFTASDATYQYSVAWIDCLATGRHLGRSVLMRGNHAPARGLPRSVPHPLQVPPRRKLSVPFHFPTVALSNLSIRAFNFLYYNVHRTATKIVDYDSFFYPLDAIAHWNRMYGRRGFVQYQAVFPEATSREGLTRLLELISARRLSSFLAVLKSSGAESPGLLSFPLQGHTLALDIPLRGGLLPLLREMDELVVRHGGRIYLAKDAAADPAIFRAMYPRLGQFQAIKRAVDPDGLFSSSMARRLGIVEGRA